MDGLLPERIDNPVDVYLSEDFRDLLNEMTYSYILDRCPDPVNFAVRFLREKKKERGAVCTIDQLPPRNVGMSGKTRRSGVIEDSVFKASNEFENFDLVSYPKSDEQKLKIIDAINRASVFRKLDTYSITVVVNAMRLLKVSENKAVIVQGDIGQHFYIIETGIFELETNIGGSYGKSNILENSGSFGDHSLVFDTPSPYTVRAKTDGEVWMLDRRTFKRVVVKCEYERGKMCELLIGNMPISHLLSHEEKLKLAEAIVSKTFRSGEWIVKQSDLAEGMYFIEKGTVKELCSWERGRGQLAKTLSPGEYFSEQALFSVQPCRTDFAALTDVRAVFLSVAEFERVVGRYLDILKRDASTFEAEVNRISKTYMISPSDFR